MAKVTRRTILGSPRIELPVIRHMVGSEVVLEFPDGVQPVGVDGDPAPSAYRISARVLPAAVEVAVHPRCYSGRGEGAGERSAPPRITNL